ncbi:MAG: hypothetical protein FWC73_08460 [Defluviitaleaceae bacterium]|nr:hypothetical protein [Defluviitaleaceae bacterium]
MQLTDDKINEIIEKIKKMAKYRDVEIPTETIQSLIKQSSPVSKNLADLEKRIREKIHNITALYLGEIDYKKSVDEFRQVKNNPIDLKEFSLAKLAFHASTKERGHDLEALYQQLFSRIGGCKSIADLACGIHPLGLPYMGLPSGTGYYAYDLNKARVDFLNIFIAEQGYAGGCFHQDILIHPPSIHFDVAFFFKEAHRFEKRQPGVMSEFLDSIKASKIVVSLPLQSLGTSSGLSPKYEKTLYEYTTEHGWSFESFTHGNEVFYIIDRGHL